MIVTEYKKIPNWRIIDHKLIMTVNKYMIDNIGLYEVYITRATIYFKTISPLSYYSSCSCYEKLIT